MVMGSVGFPLRTYTPHQHAPLVVGCCLVRAAAFRCPVAVCVGVLLVVGSCCGVFFLCSIAAVGAFFSSESSIERKKEKKMRLVPGVSFLSVSYKTASAAGGVGAGLRRSTLPWETHALRPTAFALMPMLESKRTSSRGKW